MFSCLSLVWFNKSEVFTLFKDVFPFCSSMFQRFIQYLASRNTLFNLSNFLDKGALQGKSLHFCTNVTTLCNYVSYFH